MYKINKKTIEKNYNTDLLAYTTATNENDRWTARKSMAAWERTAMEQYGFDYADSLSKKSLKQLFGK